MSKYSSLSLEFCSYSIGGLLSGAMPVCVMLFCAQIALFKNAIIALAKDVIIALAKNVIIALTKLAIVADFNDWDYAERCDCRIPSRVPMKPKTASKSKRISVEVMVKASEH